MLEVFSCFLRTACGAGAFITHSAAPHTLFGNGVSVVLCLGCFLLFSSLYSLTHLVLVACSVSMCLFFSHFLPVIDFQFQNILFRKSA